MTRQNCAPTRENCMLLTGRQGAGERTYGVRFAAAMSCALLFYAPHASSQVLTFTPKYESKLFIRTIPAADCLASATAIVGVLNPAMFAAFVAFCRATSLGELPPTGAVVVPLDARIRGEVDLKFRCQKGNATPIGPAPVTAGPTAAGLELGNLRGIV